MIKKFKEFHQWRELGIWLCLVVLILSFFDYLFYTMDQGRLDPGIENRPAVGDQTSSEPESPAEVTVEPRTLLDDGAVRIVANAQRTSFEIWNGQIKAGNIERDNSGGVEVFQRIRNHVYLGAGSVPADAEALFGGPKEIYRLDLEDNTLINIFSRDCLVSDISPDEKKIAAIERFYVGDAVATYLNVHDLAGGEDLSFVVPEAYAAAGNASFSSDGKKIVYEAAFSNKKDDPSQKFATFLVDLVGGEQKQIAEGLYGKKYISDVVVAAYGGKYGKARAASPVLESELDRGLTYSFAQSEIQLGFEKKDFLIDNPDSARFYVADSYPAVIARELNGTKPADYCAAKKQGALSCAAQGDGVILDQLVCSDSPTGGGMGCRFMRFYIAPSGVEAYPYVVASLDLGDVPRVPCGNEDYDQLEGRRKCYADHFAAKNYQAQSSDFDNFVRLLKIIT